MVGSSGGAELPRVALPMTALLTLSPGLPFSLQAQELLHRRVLGCITLLCPVLSGPWTVHSSFLLHVPIQVPTPTSTSCVLGGGHSSPKPSKFGNPRKPALVAV